MPGRVAAEQGDGIARRILGAILRAVFVPWGILFDWAKEEIKSKPRKEIM
jgi:hypothetical protein